MIWTTLSRSRYNNSHLNLISDESRKLTSNSTICLPCFKYFNAVLKQVHAQQTNVTEAQSDSAPSIDEVFAAISEKQAFLLNKGSNLLHSEYFELITCLSATNGSINCSGEGSDHQEAVKSPNLNPKHLRACYMYLSYYGREGR